MHVQLSTVLPSQSRPPPPPPQQPRYKYINPQLLVPNVPPPGYSAADHTAAAAGTSSSWRSQVDDFLYRPRTGSCSPGPVTSKQKARDKRPLSPAPELTTSTPVKKKSKFIPKAAILPPSPAGGGEVNELDTQPERRKYSGQVVDWRGKFGFLDCDDISGKIFLHSKDIVTGRSGVKVGCHLLFLLLTLNIKSKTMFSDYL